MPRFREWAETTLGIDISKSTFPQKQVPCDPPRVNSAFIESLAKKVPIPFINIKVNEFSQDDKIRIMNSHGHTLQEIFALRHGKLDAVVDGVIFIDSHNQAVHVVEMAKKHNVVLIPYGGGTNVTSSVCP